MRDKLIELLYKKQVYGVDAKQPDKHNIYLLDNDEVVDYLLANGVIVRREGEWEQFGLQNPKCSLCRSYNIEKSRFCPNCGAKMKGAER